MDTIEACDNRIVLPVQQSAKYPHWHEQFLQVHRFRFSFLFCVFIMVNLFVLGLVIFVFFCISSLLFLVVSTSASKWLFFEMTCNVWMPFLNGVVIIIIRIIIIITTTIFMVLSSWRSAIARVHPVHMINADSASVRLVFAAKIMSQPNYLTRQMPAIRLNQVYFS